MDRIVFDTRKYGRELLIDAVTEDEMEIPSERMAMSFFGLLFLKEATGYYQVDGHGLDLQGNTVLFVWPSQVHILEDVDISRCNLLFFEQAFLDDFFVDKHFIFKFRCFRTMDRPPAVHLAEADFNRLYDLSLEIKTEIRSLTQAGEHVVRSLLYYLLIRLDQHYARQHGLSGQWVADPKFRAFQQMLFSRIRQHLTVQECAEALGISRVQLNRLCQRYLSKTASQTIRERLITEIKKDLIYSGKDLTEIAYDFDFSNPANFSRFVKQMTGMSPQAYRQYVL